MKEILFFFIRFLVETTNNDTVELLSVKKKKKYKYLKWQYNIERRMWQ